MIRKTTSHIILPFLLLVLLFSACKEDKKVEDIKAEDGTYFSVRQFAQDQWSIHNGEPFLIVKTVRVNGGKLDSSYTTSDTLGWGRILDVFFETDISSPEFLGQYKYSVFPDEADDTYNYFYEALDDDVYTRKLLISASQENSRVKGIYIEAMSKTLFDEKLVKLYYKPMTRIQIQITEKPMFGESVHTVTEYEFIR